MHLLGRLIDRSGAYASVCMPVLLEINYFRFVSDFYGAIAIAADFLARCGWAGCFFHSFFMCLFYGSVYCKVIERLSGHNPKPLSKLCLW